MKGACTSGHLGFLHSLIFCFFVCKLCVDVGIDSSLTCFSGGYLLKISIQVWRQRAAMFDMCALMLLLFLLIKILCTESFWLFFNWCCTCFNCLDIYVSHLGSGLITSVTNPFLGAILFCCVCNRSFFYPCLTHKLFGCVVCFNVSRTVDFPLLSYTMFGCVVFHYRTIRMFALGCSPLWWAWWWDFACTAEHGLFDTCCVLPVLQ